MSQLCRMAATGLVAGLVLMGVTPRAVAMGPPDFDALVVFRHTGDVASAPLADFGSAPGRLLNRVDGVQQVAVVALSAGWQWQPPRTRRQSLELYVLSGTLQWGDVMLSAHDYAYLPATASAPLLAAAGEAEVLVYFDPPRNTDGNQARVLPADDGGWRPGIVAERDAGVRLALEVRDLLWVESTGQRTWLLRARPDLVVPWERHETVEEGFLVAGDYRLVECLPEGPVSGSYRPGGYFYRPAGIVHGGPESGSSDAVMWLLRTPTALTVEFLAGCDTVVEH